MATKKSEYIMPAVVLMLICAIISGLLAVVYNLTYVDNTGVLTEKLLSGCKDIFGEGEYQMIVDIDENEKKIPLTFDGVTSVILDEKGNCLFEIYADGYEKGGLDLLIAMNADGTVKDIAVVAISETPGLGSKVQDRSFLDQFRNAGGAVIAGGSSGGLYKGKKEADSSVSENAAQITAVTSATYSSAGVVEAVNLAVSTYAEMGGAQ